MKIRSITFFNGRDFFHSPSEIAAVGKTLKSIRQRLADGGYEVQTVRLAFEPVVWRMNFSSNETLLVFCRELEKSAEQAEIDYVSVGPIAGEKDDSRMLELLPELIAGTSRIFASAVLSEPGHDIHKFAFGIAKAIKQIAAMTPDGFGNLRFAALANCKNGIPFFPAAYAKWGQYSFALALECADLAVDAVRETSAEGSKVNAGLLQNSAARLTKKIESHAAAIDALLESPPESFAGCDWSLAPHPDERCSIGAAIEGMSGARFGDWGTLSAVAALTGAIRDAKVRHTGFSGVFMPMLEDAVLARRAGPDFDLQKLLLYSAVCGTGLDTIPLAGDVPAERIAGLLADVAALAAAKDKPLTARLMPIPGLKPGDMTQFDFPYLVNGKVFEL